MQIADTVEPPSAADTPVAFKIRRCPKGLEDAR
jgi:hypothetical protein